MAADSEKAFRPWVAWLIGSVWAVTALAAFAATRIRPSTTADLSVSTRKVSFRTNASHILGQSNEEQLLISGVSSLRIQFNKERTVKAGSSSLDVVLLAAEGNSRSSCSLYRVRSGGFEVSGPAVITLEVFDAHGKSFSLQSHGMLTDNLSSRPSEHGLAAGFECREMRTNGGPVGDVEGSFSPEGGDSIFIATQPDARLDFSATGHLEISDTQIPILGELRFSDIYPGSSEEKSVLLKPVDVVFEKLNKKVTIDPGDLMVVVPRKNFYLRQFTVKDGIQLSLHGDVRDVRAGAGARALATVMPSTFDHLENAIRIWGAITALAGFLLGILEKIGVLGRS